jgi:hypothetical protein
MNNAVDIIQSVKTALTVALSTLGAGIGTILNLMPDILGWVATVTGIALSIALIIVHWAKYKQITLETEVLRAKEEERIRKAEKDNG